MNNPLDNLDDDLEISIDDATDIINDYQESESNSDPVDDLGDMLKTEKQRQSIKKPPYKNPIFIAAGIGGLALAIISVKYLTSPIEASPAPVASQEVIPTHKSITVDTPENKGLINYAANKKVALIDPVKPLAMNKGASQIDTAIAYKPQSRLPSLAAGKPSTQSQPENDKKIIKLEAINKELNRQLAEEKKLSEDRQAEIVSLKNKSNKTNTKAMLANRKRIAGMTIIDFADQGAVAVIRVVGRSKDNQVIALSLGEKVRVGNGYYTVQQVDPKIKRVLIGNGYFVDSTLTQYQRPVAEVPHEKKNMPKSQKHMKYAVQPKIKLKRVKEWQVVFTGTNNQFSVVESQTGVARRLQRGSKLSPYGKVLNILRDGSLVFKNHAITLTH